MSPENFAAEIGRLRSQVAQLEMEVARGREAHERERETAHALGQSEGMLRSILENAPDLIVLVDRQGRMMYVNRLEHDYTREEIVGQCVYDFVVPEHRHFIQSAVERALETGRAEEYEVRERRSRRWYHARAVPVMEEGETASVMVICLDVHDKREQEEALRESEQRLRMVLRQIPGKLWTTDTELRFTTSIGAGVAPVGLQQNHVVGLTLEEFLETEDRSFPPLAAAYRALAGESANYVHEWGGNWYRCHIEPLRDAEGAIIGTVGVTLDITEHRRAELEREESIRKFEILAKNIPGVVYLCHNDPRYSVIFLNDEIENLLGIPAADFLEGRASYMDLVHPDDATAVPAAVNTAISRRERFHLTYRLRHADGHWIWAEEYGQGVFSEDGELQFLEGTIFDITSRREAEEMLRRSKAELEELVNCRTQELRTANRLLREDYLQQLELTRVAQTSEERLQSQTRMLRRMLFVHDRDRQLIAYEIHDGIVQYMAGITMHLQAAAVKLESDPDGARRDLETSAGMLSETIDEARRLIDGLRPGVLEEQGVVPAVEYLCQQTQRRHGVRVEMQADVAFERLAPAVEMAIYRIVQEGLSNIVKHSQSKVARVVLSQRETELIIKIQDAGIGFDPRRVDSRRYGLTGIRDRARLLGGQAKINSEPGRGTRLRIKLPLQDVLLPEGWQQPEAILSKDDSSNDWNGASTEDSQKSSNE